MERGTATVLFTDLVGSTELSVSLGAAYDDARRAHDALLRATIEANGGAVIKGLGDGVMGTFATVPTGWPALREAQAAIHRLNQRQPDVQPVDPRRPVRRRRQLRGRRLLRRGRRRRPPACATMAEGDQILATSVVQSLAGGARAEGFARGRPAGAEGPPRPRRGGRGALAPPRRHGHATAGPARCRACLLRRSLRRARPAPRVRHRVQGPRSPAGRPRRWRARRRQDHVVSRAIRHWFDAGATVAMGRCEEDVRAPYRPFIDALGHLVRRAPDDLLEGHVERHGPRLLPLRPGLGHRVGPLPRPDVHRPRDRAVPAVRGRRGPAGRPRRTHARRAVPRRPPLGRRRHGLAAAQPGQPTRAGPAARRGHLPQRRAGGRPPMGQALAAFRRVAAVTRVQLEGLDRPRSSSSSSSWTGAERRHRRRAAGQRPRWPRRAATPSSSPR